MSRTPESINDHLSSRRRHLYGFGAVIGRAGDPETLPEKLKAREAPSGRKPISDFAFAGPFPARPRS